MVDRLPRIELAPGLVVPRILTGLWQVADMERGGVKLDQVRTAAALGDYAGICGYLLAKSHARTSGASMIAGYIGGSDKLDQTYAQIESELVTAFANYDATFMTPATAFSPLAPLY